MDSKFEIIDTPQRPRRGAPNRWGALFEEVVKLPPGKGIKVYGQPKPMSTLARLYGIKLGQKFTVNKLDNEHVAISVRALEPVGPEQAS